MRAEVTVLAFCAEWCAACREFRAVFDAVARLHPGLAFRWIDIDRDEALIEVVEIESFPTIALMRQGVVLYEGAMRPDAAVFERLLRVFAA